MQKSKLKKASKILNYSKNPYSFIPEVVKRILKYKKSGTVLDIGPGKRGYDLFLAKKGFRVTVLDIAKENLVALRAEATLQKVKLQYVEGDIRTYQPKKKYDVVIARYVLHFLKPNEIQKTIKQMQEYTKPGGLNVIGVHTDKNPKGHRATLFKKDELRKYYRDWKILYYKEEWTLPFRIKEGEKPVRRHKAELIARKP